jgi:aspartyl/asparaginyl-tRNA synthetase
MCFLNLRQRTESVQGLLIVTPEKVSKQMVKWTASIAAESIVLVEGVIEKVQETIKSASVGDVEVHISKVKLARSSLCLDSDSIFVRFILSLESKVVFPSRSMMPIVPTVMYSPPTLSLIGFCLKHV